MRLSLILPCFNEEANIERAVADVLAWFNEDGIEEGEIIVVNDGSTDGTHAILDELSNANPQVRVVRHEINLGYGAAVRSGCDAAKEDLIAFMDSDGQFDPRDFRNLLQHMDQYDFVTGKRRKRADPFLRKMNAKLFGLLVWIFLGVWVRDINCAMKVFRRSIWQKIRPTHSTGALFNAEIFYNLKKEGIAWHQVNVAHYPRKFGQQTGANLSVILRMFRELWELKKRT